MSLLHQVALTYINKIGSVHAKTLVSYMGGAEKVFSASHAQLLRAPGIGEKIISLLNFNEALEKAKRELEFIEKNKIDVIFYTDARYPKRLKNCHDAPVLLYGKGNYDLNPPHVISIVGTRNATDYGRLLCKQLIEELQQYNVLIVSGL
ncbi:MAG: DNA-processing protein DprA, partial [Mucilaginibacter sp.]